MPLHDEQHPPSYVRRPWTEPVRPHLDNGATDALLTATGRGDLGAFAELYDRMASTVFGLLHAGSQAAGQATERVFLSVWSAAPGFEPARRSAYSTLMVATRRELASQVSAAVVGAWSKDGSL